jgi:hypothetical protein
MPPGPGEGTLTSVELSAWTVHEADVLRCDRHIWRDGSLDGKVPHLVVLNLEVMIHAIGTNSTSGIVGQDVLCHKRRGRGRVVHGLEQEEGHVFR